ncbi:hypothetical protein [Oceanibacterium hippocampi]|uniref:Citrate transporter n=1 Tax=Oceanibacterium hippocampi TaxID=745714 RepID=A0A1Y5THJ6_9PROT|nr:hypothetical protein [Oceanibacterium hippocampi]SLN63802.1 hypothetical protein OCH7691_02875 [Oceanibacterium hippocampi]
MSDAPALSDPPSLAQAAPVAVRDYVATSLLLLCVSLTTVGLLWKLPVATTAATLALGAFAAFEFVRVPRLHLMTGAILGTVGLLAVFPSGDYLAVVKRAAEGTLIFGALFASVAFLQYPAVNSPSIRAAREFVVNQPAGRRYATLTFAAHFFGAVTNFATLSLLSTFLIGQKDQEARERMACAMIRGFALAAFWSPLFVAIAVVMYVLPQLGWLELAVPGMPLAFLLLGYGWLFDRVMNRPGRDSKGAAAGPTPAAVPARRLEGPVIARIGFLAFVIVGLILIASESLSISTPIALFLVLPLISIVWQWLLVRSASGGTMSRMADRVIVNVCNLRAEIVLFFSANFLGYALATAIDPEMVATLLLDLGIVGWLAIYLLLAVMLVCTMLMIHPLVLIVLLGQVFPGEAIGVHDVSLGLCMGLLWGVGTASTPTSGLTLFMSRILERSPWYVSWRLNGLYSFGGLIVGAAYISVLNRWLL